MYRPLKTIVLWFYFRDLLNITTYMLQNSKDYSIMVLFERSLKYYNVYFTEL
jgi:hypothetical protein